MKKSNLLLVLVLVFTFTGGFLAGTLYTKDPAPRISKKMTDSSESSKHPFQKTLPNVEDTKENVVIGYIQDFRNPDMVHYSDLTHIIFSFAHPTKDGNIILNGESALNNLRKTVLNAHQNDTKVILAVGGWFHINGGVSYDYFEEAIRNPESRTRLIEELLAITEEENLDGIDIDFEHPRTNEDAKNLAIFTKDLSSKLHHEGKEVSIAVNAKIHSVAGTEINNVVYEPSMFEAVNHVNIMAYDGQWDGGYNASNLSPYPYTENIVKYWTNLFDTYQLPREKLVLGVPLYAQPENPEISQVSYSTIIKANSENAERDTVSLNDTVYHYNGEETIRKKTKLALDHGFGGMMLWELGHDIAGSKRLTAVISTSLKKERDLVFSQNRSE